MLYKYRILISMYSQITAFMQSQYIWIVIGLLFLASAPEGYAHWKRQKRLDAWFSKKNKKKRLTWEKRRLRKN